MSTPGELIRGMLERFRPNRSGAAEAGDPGFDVVSALQADVPPEPRPGAMERGRQRLFSQLSEVPAEGEPRMIFGQFAASPLVAAVAGAAILLGGMAGVSAATGGPNVTTPVRDAVGGDNQEDSTFTPTVTPSATPDDDDDDDNSGPGGGGDDDSPESPGASPDDHGGDRDDNSGHGSGGDDDDDSPPSPGATPDDDGDDNSGHGSGGDDDGDDNSGHGGGDDDGGDDNSGSGS